MGEREGCRRGDWEGAHRRRGRGGKGGGGTGERGERPKRRERPTGEGPQGGRGGAGRGKVGSLLDTIGVPDNGMQLSGLHKLAPFRHNN